MLKKLADHLTAVTGPLLAASEHVRWLVEAVQRVFFAEESRSFQDAAAESLGFAR